MQLKHDYTLDIAIGRSREEKRWQNKEMMWSSLVERVKDTHRTAETYAEYMKAKPARQDVIKDIGGFVGGIIQGGRRKKGSVVHRQLLTLDLDFAPSVPDFWDNVLLLGYAAAAYSTHKHSPASPRLRLLIPIDRPVTPDEYEAIARKIASYIDIEWFDPTTFQPSRLMYWPSTAKDGEFYSNVVDDIWLKADDVLAQYRDWQDSSQWPVSSKSKEKVHTDIKQQGDPLVKSGLVGAFCRTYSISGAIEKFLSDIYIATESEDRYTYINGSTANGLVVYDDVFAYSHHASDPVSEKTCNAWDLVRIHKFKHLDEKHDPTAIGAKLPSFSAMSDLAGNDAEVRKTIGEEKLKEAQEAFGDVAPESDGALLKDEKDWMSEMEVDRAGLYTQTINNIVLILENDPGLVGCFALDDFDHRETIAKDLPWRKMGKADNFMTKSDDSNLRHYLELIYGITATAKITDALVIVQNRHKYHPVYDWLTSLEWDGTPRAETILIRYLGAADNAYVRGVTRKTLLACVTRIMEPGCKFDNMLVIIGEQGIGKSTLPRRLGYKWFSDSFTTVQGKDALEQLQGAWIIEAGELNGIRKAEAEAIKHFIAKQVDRFRVAYGERVESFPRQCVFFGTTNNPNFLKDPTGNRRFWPIMTDMDNATENIFARLTKSEVEQIWAEVVGWYSIGEDLYLDALVEMEARIVQAKHMEMDDRLGALQVYLDTPVPTHWPELSIYDRRAYLQSGDDDMIEKGTVIRNEICAAEVWCEMLGGQIKDMTTWNTKDVHNLLRRVTGWECTEKYKRYKLYGRQKIYVRSE